MATWPSDFQNIKTSNARLSFLDTDGKTFSSRGVSYLFNSPREFTQTMRGIFSSAQTSHSVTNPELELISDREGALFGQCGIVLSFALLGAFCLFPCTDMDTTLRHGNESGKTGF
jgi:hypothetical protein